MIFHGPVYADFIRQIFPLGALNMILLEGHKFWRSRDGRLEQPVGRLQNGQTTKIWGEFQILDKYIIIL